jgi:hypothetical protein
MYYKEKNYAANLRLVLCILLANYPNLIAAYFSHGPARAAPCSIKTRHESLVRISHNCRGDLSK